MKQRPPITLSTGRIVLHRPYLSNGEPNGATEAYLQDGSEMTDDEWAEYCSILNNRPLTTVGETA